jgi:hypothetical protein
MSRVLLSAAAALLLAACATPTVYGPAATPTASGYSEMKIQSDRFRVTFRGGSNATAKYVRDLALRYAADVTLREGYDWFRVAGSYTDAIGGGGPTIGIGIGGASYGRSSAVGVGGDVAFPVGGAPRVAETLEIVLGKGSLPDGGDAYDAREVRESLAVPPPAAG